VNAPIDETYFAWLYELTEAPSHKNPARSYFLLMGQLYTKPFRWHIRNDDNREMDGRELREEFLRKHSNYSPSDEWMDLPCSMLEMLLALSRRVAFDSYGSPAAWFWKLIENIELRNFRDIEHNHHFEEEIDFVLERIISRTYGRDGTGGLFPLRRSPRDQRRVELAYQMEAYLLEGEEIPNGP
jgi:hypothetical protein